VTATRIDRSELPARAGEKLGVSPWHTITQEQIDRFADATLDHQWIHVDAERAAASPVGGTIAHGFLTLSLAVVLLEQTVEVAGCSQVINYGLNKVRFPSVVPVGSKVRMHVELVSVEEQADSSLQATYSLVFEREGGTKPVCVAESLLRYYP
jgi:acyl dehydratase